MKTVPARGKARYGSTWSLRLPHISKETSQMSAARSWIDHHATGLRIVAGTWNVILGTILTAYLSWWRSGLFAIAALNFGAAYILRGKSGSRPQRPELTLHPQIAI
jgi:hypothetical protein